MFSNYKNKRLNEIVFPGSHDAGITGGGANAQTQTYDILEQARYGARYFDVRLLGRAGGHGIETYHGKGILGPKKSKIMLFGTWGLGLTKIINDCNAFLDEYGSEFLILRISKSKPWPDIAQAFIDGLGNRLYRGGGNLNLKTPEQLKGKIVVVFDEAARKDLGKKTFTATDDGFELPVTFSYVKSLIGDDDGSHKSYERDYDGLQYFGKFGATTFTGALLWKAKSIDKKISVNKEKQIKTLKSGASHAKSSPEILGMMYWTTTGVLQDIIKRNAEMWKGNNSRALREVWASGFQDALDKRIPELVNWTPKTHRRPLVLKAFMPNIVMIDNVNKIKCDTIWSLNEVAEQQLQDTVDTWNRLYNL